MKNKTRFLPLLSASVLLLAGCGGSLGSSITKDKATTILTTIQSAMKADGYKGPSTISSDGQTSALVGTTKINYTTTGCVNQDSLYSFNYIVTDGGLYHKQWTYWDNNFLYVALSSTLDLTTFSARTTPIQNYAKKSDESKTNITAAIALQQVNAVEILKKLVNETLTSLGGTSYDTPEYYSNGDGNLTFNMFQDDGDGGKTITYTRAFDKSLPTKYYDLSVASGGAVSTSVSYSYSAKSLSKPDLSKMSEVADA